MSVALAWLLRRSPNILLIPGTSSAAHLRENVAGAGLALSDEDLAELDKIQAVRARATSPRRGRVRRSRHPPGGY